MYLRAITWDLKVMGRYLKVPLRYLKATVRYLLEPTRYLKGLARYLRVPLRRLKVPTHVSKEPVTSVEDLIMVINADSLSPVAMKMVRTSTPHTSET